MTTIYSPINLTSNTSNGVLVPSASTNSTDAWLAFNSSASDYWSPTVSTTGEFLQIDLGVSVAVNLVRVLCDTSVATPTAITISGSANGSSFTTITALTGLTFTTGVFTDLVVTIPTNTVYRYYRLVLVNQNGAASRIISAQFCRTSSSVYGTTTINPTLVKSATTITDVPYWDSQLERPTKSVSNYATVKLNVAGEVLRPVQGQIFPRGYPIKSQTITINPVTEPNLFNFSLIQLEEMTGFGGVTPYLSNLTSACGAQAYQPTGSFCNILYPDDKNAMWKHSLQMGATWNAPSFTGTGVLVVDLLSSKTFNQVNVFQMFDDSKATHIQMYSHPSTSGTAPGHTDSSWSSLFTETTIGAGTTGYSGYTLGAGALLSTPTVISFSAATSRYVKIHLRNTGALGGGQYIELGGIKLFNV
jgi:hypothetical protein